MTYDEAVTAHIKRLRIRNLRPDTIRQRRYALRRFQRRLGDIDPLVATPEDLEAWALQIEPLSPHTRSAEIAHVAQFYRWAVLSCLIDRDPTLELPRPKKSRSLPRPMAQNDVLIAIAGAPKDERMWFLLAGWAGLRCGEIARLQREHILDTQEHPVMRVLGKGGKERIVPVGPRLLMELQAYGLPSRGYIFGRLDGTAGGNSPARLSQRANRCLHGLGITATLHQLRHRFGTDFYAASNGDIRQTQEVLGHGDPLTTAGYAAYSPAKAIETSVKLDEQLGQVLIDTQQLVLM